MSRKILVFAVLLVTVLGVFGWMGAGTSGAAQLAAFEYSGKAFLNSGFPCALPKICKGDFTGKATGGGVNGAAFKCVPGCVIDSFGYTYSEPSGKCVNNAPLAPLGTANGIITLHPKTGPAIPANFNWTRVGLTAVVLLSNPTGVSVALFKPPTSCKPTTAAIYGVSVLA